MARACAHVVEGLATTLLVFPFVRQARRRALTRAWSRRLLRQLGVRLHVRGEAILPAHPRGLMIVANHVSWLDIVVLNALEPSRFVAKAELRRWLVLGWLIASAGTLFIERERRLHAHRANRAVAQALLAGDIVTVFPEGQTSDGRALLPFHASLLQPAIDAGGAIVPAAIRYTDAGAYTDAPAYVGDAGLVGSVWRVVGLAATDATVWLLPALDADARHRRELARVAEDAIRAALAAADDGSAPGKSGGPRAASQ